MAELYYWGEQGQYGPFGDGGDGYPYSGEVLRHYRVAVNRMSATKFGKLYGQALGEKAKSRIWVLQMERTNAVPLDITRRRVIASILGIPPVLLGLGEEMVRTSLTLPEVRRATARLPKRVKLDKQTLHEYQQSLAQYFAGYYHRHGQAVLDHVEQAASEIGVLVTYAQERHQQQGIALISRYHQFAVNIAREQQSYDQAREHAQKAIEHAAAAHQMKPNSDLMAIALLRRGLTSFEQAATSASREGLDEATVYLNAALSHTPSALSLTGGFVSLEWALVHAYTAQTQQEKAQVMKRLDLAYRPVAQHYVEDDENFMRYSAGWYYLTRAEALIALGMYVDALGELEIAEEKTPLTLPRRFAYIDTLRARAYIGLGEYEEALNYAMDGLKASRAVKSEFNIARIVLLQKQLEASGYGKSSDVEQFGRKLRKTHPHLFLG